MSFGLSRGKALVTEGYGIEAADLPPLEAGRIDPREWFPQPERAFEIEIGSGKGTFLVQQAELQREMNFLGIEWAGEFYRYAADRVRRRELENVRMLRADAAEFIRFRCADAVASTIHLYFSDPWPKKRHHKRRVIQDHTLPEFHRVLRNGGRVHLVTDHEELHRWHLDHVARHADLFEQRPFNPPESGEENEIVGTNFERKYRREGRPFHAFTLVKRDRSPQTHREH